MTEAVKFMPGPWQTQQAERPPHHHLLIDVRGRSIGLVFRQSGSEEETGIANACLIEQAPNLFDLLVTARAMLADQLAARPVPSEQLVPLCAMIDHALDRAEGRR
jgi:hypothetical protein